MLTNDHITQRLHKTMDDRNELAMEAFETYLAKKKIVSFNFWAKS